MQNDRQHFFPTRRAKRLISGLRCLRWAVVSISFRDVASPLVVLLLLLLLLLLFGWAACAVGRVV